MQKKEIENIKYQKNEDMKFLIVIWFIKIVITTVDDWITRIDEKEKKAL